MTAYTRPDATRRRQQIAYLRAVEGLSQSQTAKRLGVSIITVKRADALRRQLPAESVRRAVESCA